MAFFVVFVGVVLATASATSPLIDETVDSVVPVPKPPIVSVPRKCPENEVLKLRTSCPPDTCDTEYLSVLCIANQTKSLMCTCKDNYLRTNSTGICIPIDRCLPPECANDPNAKRGCGNRCKKTCADYNDTNKVCKNNVCKLFGCECKDGFVYDENVKICVKPSQCTKQCKKPHERYTGCFLGECIPKTCNDLGKPIPCASIASPCAGGCICEEGYVRDCNGNCIEKSKCPSCGGDPNAQSGCGNPCGKTCDSRGINKSELVCPQYCEDNGCDCRPGFLLDTSTDPKKCVPEQSCPKPPPKCGENEQFYCGPSCPEPSCENSKPQICINKKCKLACFCKKGFVRNANNKCVPVDKCPSQCKGPNEVYSSCPIGQCVPKTCDDLITPPPCPRVIPPCPGGCICKDGYLRNANGTCIEKNKCPKQCKQPNERYTDCVLGACVPKTCDDVGKPIACAAVEAPCAGGCICAEGFVRNSNGDCIEQSKCPKLCKKPNESYTNCLLGQCGPKTCDDLGKPIACAAVAAPCAGGCICAQGFVRNSNGDCIETSKCPSCGGDPNAQSGCGNPCGKTCDSRGINKSELVCPQYCEFNGCDCRPGFLLDTDAKKCVPEESCPNPQQCKNPNERYSKCFLGECIPKTCDDLGKPIPCPSIADPCAGGCICIDGYLRDSNGTCIEKSQCSCGGDPNAVPGCGNPCGKTCASRAPNVAQIACPLYCRVDGCDCKKGFLLDTDSNKCVPELLCPKPSQPTCKGPHEVYNSCPAGQCGPKTCDNLINPAPCPRVKPPCPGGCLCEEGYLRDSNGICIEKNKCPQLACSSNQTYVSCSVNCPDKYCPENDQPQPVCDPPRNCPPGCTCKINYRLDKSGQCILASECPPINCTRQNEEYNSCPSDCSSDRCEDADSPPAVCNTLLLNCQPKCVCKENHFRNQDGLCIPAKECPSVCKDPNAEWKDCRDPCPGTCQNTRPGCLSKKCTAGCQCKEGYVLSKPGGQCVKIDTCADYVNCGANQTFVYCTFKCPQVMCPESDQTILCKPPRDCPGGCGCKPKYRYNAEGQCILGSDCPQVECTRPNEEWSPCRSDYDWERCDERFNSPPIVGDDDAPCNPRCTCIKGYFKNNAYECVPEKECPSQPEKK